MPCLDASGRPGEPLNTSERGSTIPIPPLMVSSSSQTVPILVILQGPAQGSPLPGSPPGLLSPKSPSSWLLDPLLYCPALWLPSSFTFFNSFMSPFVSLEGQDIQQKIHDRTLLQVQSHLRGCRGIFFNLPCIRLQVRGLAGRGPQSSSARQNPSLPRAIIESHTPYLSYIPLRIEGFGIQ